MVSNGKSTRNADLRHAQSIGRQRNAAQRAAADVSLQELADILPHDGLPMLPDAAPVSTPADEASADMPRLSWRGHAPTIVHSLKWKDGDGHEHLHIARADDLDELLLHLRKVKAAIAAARARDGAGDSVPASEELPPCPQVSSALHRDADDPEAAPYCSEHDMRFFRNVWKNGRVSWSHRKADGSGFCRYKG